MTAWALITSPAWVPLLLIIVAGTVKLWRGKDWGV
jgi:hypothetical protein